MKFHPFPIKARIQSPNRPVQMWRFEDPLSKPNAKENFWKIAVICICIYSIPYSAESFSRIGGRENPNAEFLSLPRLRWRRYYFWICCSRMNMTSLEANGISVVSEPPPVYVAMVDPFLVEALQNPRHRLTILRMELDVQKFFQDSDLQMFVFPHFPTSYLRLAAHRVAQHYGLQTMIQDNVVDGQGSRILVIKKPDSKFPAICLSDVPAKEAENDKSDQIKIVIRPRASRGSSGDANEQGTKRSSVRTVEERKEEYDRARARIFHSSSGSESEDVLTQVASDVRNLTLDENEISRNLDMDGDKSICSRDAGSSLRVAIFRDREKDRTDPDYDRSYGRYVKSTPNTQNFSLAPCNLQKFQPPFFQYDSVFPQLHQMPAPQASLNYSSPVMSPYCAVGVNQTPRDALYMQWQQTQSMMYAHSYNQMRRTLFQAPFCQQPLSFDYSQNH